MGEQVGHAEHGQKKGSNRRDRGALVRPYSELPALAGCLGVLEGRSWSLAKLARLGRQ